MTLFNGIAPFYIHERTAYVFGLTLLVVILVFLVLAATFLIILPGIRGRGRIYSFCRVILSLLVGVIIVVVNFTSDWEEGHVTVNTTYKAFSSEMITARVGLQIGLAGINVTLKGLPVNQLNETINYNENFLWKFELNYDEQSHKGLERGLPNPILYIAEKFTSKAPCLINVQYRFSGHYATAMMWVAFCAWIISNILFCMSTIVYGGYMTLVTSAFMIFGVISFATTRNVPQCIIQFGPATLRTSLSVSFWLTLATALVCLLLGILIIAMDHFMPEKLRAFFILNGEDDDQDEMRHGIINNYFKDDCIDTIILKDTKSSFENKDFVVYT
ncbi:dual oxidase maturation factor 2 [Leucoraja erinacea]|uniref:dual oxidase maturation factor 2 n=1 Tax=Leucoraja erinaceus TaxID=7782 RepID=UPI0024576D5C|nr:dual oxidase maturation factor 2 [Leucoraja erinacea]XP_055518489.1 dual oxidase maturation factor 2 [Leucoraja erinacea]